MSDDDNEKIEYVSDNVCPGCEGKKYQTLTNGEKIWCGMCNGTGRVSKRETWPPYYPPVKPWTPEPGTKPWDQPVPWWPGNDPNLPGPPGRYPQIWCESERPPGNDCGKNSSGKS